MQNGYMILKKWIISNTCSADSVTNNLDYVEDVKYCDKHKILTVLANRGLIIFD